MAIININANLNGGDDTTPDNELFYRIYGDVDAYASPIHTTGTAIADADVTVTGDVVDISNVDGTTNTSFKISAVDGAGNEGILSDAVSSDVLFQDNFAGTDFNPDGNWVLTNAEPSKVDFTQNNKLVIYTDATGGASDYADDLISSASTYTLDSELCLIFDYYVSAGVSNSALYVVMTNAISGSTDQCICVLDPSANTMAITPKINGTPNLQEVSITQSVGIKNTFKFRLLPTGIITYIWSGSDWTELTNDSGTLAASEYMVNIMGRALAGTETLEVGQIYLTNEDVLTQYP